MLFDRIKRIKSKRKRFVAFTALFTALVYFVVLIIFNLGLVHKFVTTQINDRLLADSNIRVDYDRFGLKFFPPALTVSGVKIFDSTSSEEFLEVGKLSVGPNFTGATAFTRFAIDAISVENISLNMDLDENGKIIMPFKQKEHEEKSPGLLLSEVLELVRKRVPRNIIVNDLNFTIGRVEKTHYQTITIKKLKIFNHTLLSKKGTLEFSIDGAHGKNRTANTSLNFDLLNISASGELYNNNRIAFSQFDIDTNRGALKTSGSFLLSDEFSESSYVMKVDTTAEFEPLMALADLKGRGEIRAEGYVSSVDGIAALPKFSGKLSWKNINLDDFDIYSGESFVTLEDKVIHIAQSTIVTPKKAELKFTGKFNLHNQFDFIFNTSIKQLTFTELMKGLDVPTQVVDFDIDSDNITVEGKVDNFKLMVNGHLTASLLSLPESPKFSGVPFPTCDVALSLSSTDSLLDVGKSSLTCGLEKAELLIPKGTVRYKDGLTDFSISGRGLNIESVQNFTNSPVGGFATFTSELKGSDRNPLTFRAQTFLEKATLYGFKARSLRGEWGINSDAIFGEDIRADLGAETSAQLNINSFKVDFNNDAFFLQGIAAGQMSAVRNAVQEHLPATFPHVDGRLSELSFTIEGPSTNLEKWSYKSHGKVTDLTLYSRSFKEFGFLIDCKNSLCVRSKAYLNGMKVEGEPSYSNSQLLVDISELSTKSSHIKILATGVPLKVALHEIAPMQGRLDAQVDLRGTVETPEVYGKLSVDNFSLSEFNFGPTVISGTLDSGGLDAKVISKYNQLFGRLRSNQKLDGPSSIFLIAQGLDVTSFLSDKLRSSLGLHSATNAEFTLSGPGPLSKTPQWLNQWAIDSNIKSLTFGLQKEKFVLERTPKLVFRNSALEVGNLDFKSKNSTLSLNGSYNTKTQQIDGKLDTNIKLKLLENFLSSVTFTEGSIKTKVAVTGKYPDINTVGDAWINGENISLREFPPSISKLNGKLSLHKNHLRIDSMHMLKGTGSIDLSGRVGWENWILGKSSQPEIDLEMVAKNAQVRFPAPPLSSFDTTLDGSLKLKGTESPYKLSGNIFIPRAIGYSPMTCPQFINAMNARTSDEVVANELPFLNFAVSIAANNSVAIQSNCLRSKFSVDLNLLGTPDNPSILGIIRGEGGSLILQKTRFQVKKASLTFENPTRIDPRIESEFVANIGTYSAHVSLEGFASAPKPTVWADPATYPNGEALSQGEIITMIARNTPPKDSDRTATQNVANTALSFVSNPFDDELSETVSKLTGGVIDNIQIQPGVDNSGTGNVKARISRSLGERVNLSLDLDPASSESAQSLRGTWLINDNINILGGYEHKTIEGIGTQDELSGDLRFQFGGK